MKKPKPHGGPRPEPRRPASLRRRLALGAATLVVGALLLTWLVNALVLRHFLQAQIDSRLDTQVATVAAALAPATEGGARLTHGVEGPPFDRPDSGWFWEVLVAGRVAAHSPGGGRLAPLPPEDADRPPRPALRDPPPQGRPHPPRGAEAAGPDGAPLRLRVTSLRMGDEDIEVVAAAPLSALFGPLHEVLASLALALGALGAGLLAAVGVQVRLGLGPLRRLEAGLAAVRSGRIERIPVSQPAEIAPIVAELNALLDQNDQNLVRARRHVANLAHGLKTPLATLALQFDARDPDGQMRGLVELMDRRIRHHLGRARAAALGGPTRARTELAPRIDDLAAALPKIYADRGIACTVAVASGLTLGCDAQDVDEMMGNLMDNAFKWGRSRVRVEARAEGRSAIVSVEDDGPGLPESAIPDALRPGRRLDEAAPGHGFGLPIARELTELYGGALTLGRAALGGLKVELTLPLAEG